MIVGPVAVALAGAAAGVACCSAWMIAAGRDGALEAPALRSAAAMLAFLAVVIAWVQFGLGGLFGGSLETMLSLDTDAFAGRRIVPLFGMWACLAAALEAAAGAAVLRCAGADAVRSG
jgi:hypothetical protein